MKERMKHFMGMLMVLMVCLACPACSSDDDEQTDEASTMAEMLEGTWQWDSDMYYKFYKDGTGEWYSIQNGTYLWRYYFNWTYDTKTQIIAMRFDDEDDNEDFLVVSISENYLKVKSRDSDGSWFDKVTVLPRVE
jgi:hypothetical protein